MRKTNDLTKFNSITLEKSGSQKTDDTSVLLWPVLSVSLNFKLHPNGRQ